MKIDDALVGVSSILLDTAPVIYFIEKNPTYFDRSCEIIRRIGFQLAAVATPITLAECLIGPLRKGDAQIAFDFIDFLTGGRGISFHDMKSTTARDAASIRATHNLSLPDSFQGASSLECGCDAILTNDHMLKRLPGIRVLVMDDLTL